MPNVTDAEGIPGQGGIANPYSDFGSHYVVSVADVIYDPSYGGVPFSSLEVWEANSIDGFFVPKREIDRAGNNIKVLYLRKNKSEIDVKK